MIAFLAIALLMTAVALAWIVVPLLRQHPRAAIAREAMNVAILRDQVRELEAELASGSLSSEQHEQAKRELLQRVLQESVPAEHDAAAASPAKGRRTLWAIAGVVPAAALALYALWGNPLAFAPAAQVASTGEHPMSAQEIEPLLAKLVARLEKEPGNGEGWSVLARTYYAMNRYPEAAKAFERATALLPNDAALLADYADSLAATQSSLQGKPTALVMQALKIDPTNWKALALAGTAAFDRKEYKQAVTYWEDMKKVVPPDSPMAASIDSSIAEARQLGGLPAATTGGAMAAAGASATAPNVARNGAATTSAASAPAASGPGGKVEGTVVLSPQLAAKAAPDDVVFIFARPAEGSRMPLAIIRRQVKDLPTAFTLDETNAMAPNMTIASVPDIVVGARVSKSGTAMPGSGDLEGYSARTKAGASGLKIVIDRALP